MQSVSSSVVDHPARNRKPTLPSRLSRELQHFVESSLLDYPWRVEMTDWEGNRFVVGRGETHFYGEGLRVNIKTQAAAKDLLALDGMRFLERFLAGEVDFEGNLHLLSTIRQHAKLQLKPWELATRFAKRFAFQTTSRARVNVKSHYDIPQEVLHQYLDRVYMSYSCGMWEEPERIDRDQLRQVGSGANDDFDSLEKAHWRKFKDAVDYVAPKPGETLLDVGCGYGGQLVVALEQEPFGKVVGWTHSRNQVVEGRRMLGKFPTQRWELNEGDYREDHRVFDHVTSTGMVSHVGPRGLVPYVRNIRKRIKTGGHYVHHALMTAYSPMPLDLNVGIAFNKKYVWPGFHWFTLGEHVRALEKNGFQIVRLTSLTKHYAKTTAAWYERMMHCEEAMTERLGVPTFRAWQVYLAGITGSFLDKQTHVYRIYCEAV